MTSSAASSAEKRGPVVFIKVDTLGDLVLFAPTLNTIRDAWPQRRLIVLIRQAYADIAPRLAAGIEWITTTIDPFGHGPSEEAEEFARLRKVLSEIQPETVVAATSRRTWVEIGLAATSGATQRMALGSDAHDEFFATQLRLMLAVDASAAFNEHLPIEPTEPDWQRNWRLADALLGAARPRIPVRLELVPATDGAADRVLRERQLESRRFAICAAAGFANVALKTWPADRFAAVIRHLQANHGVRTLLIGAESERAHLEGIAAAS
ncbi:MAG TPA: glycosyltransferase family 9 protein, partial [Pirellulales bacterium]|nr:glycosyltransferase family 9 protein [Pirellulales bacterium]